MAEKKDKTGVSFSAEEKAAMKDRAAELRAQEKAKKATDKAAALEQTVLDKIAEMPESDRRIAERIHAIVKEVAPQLGSKTWYGMPAYTDESGSIIAFFQGASKFEVRYATLGFNPDAKLDDGAMWPTAYAVTDLTPEVEKRIADLIRTAVD